RIYAKGDLFRALRDLRKTGKPPAAAASMRAPREAPANPSAPPDLRALAGGSLLDSILEATESEPFRPGARRDDLQSFVESVVAPHLAAAADPELPRSQ